MSNGSPAYSCWFWLSMAGARYWPAGVFPAPHNLGTVIWMSNGSPAYSCWFWLSMAGARYWPAGVFPAPPPTPTGTPTPPAVWPLLGSRL